MSRKKRVKGKLSGPGDYEQPGRGDAFSDSDLHAAAGVTIRTSNQESREEKAQRTLAAAEEEERKARDR
jgi:hypothetical protein